MVLSSRLFKNIKCFFLILYFKKWYIASDPSEDPPIPITTTVLNFLNLFICLKPKLKLKF